MSDIFDDEGDAFNQIQSLKAENKQLKADIKQTKGLVLNAYRDVIDTKSHAKLVGARWVVDRMSVIAGILSVAKEVR